MTTNSVPRPNGPRPRGIASLRRAVKWLAIGVLLLIVLGVGYQTIAAEVDKHAFAASGQLIDVNGHRMHLFCTGEGGPTVILEAGAFSFSSEWYWVQRQLEPAHRVCSYDRAGNGWSEPVAGPRDGLTLTSELHTLLQQADVPGPYVMVGHSLGGVLAPIFAAQYPDEVVGAVLVDSAVPQSWADRAAFEAHLTQFPNPYDIVTAITRVGIMRLILLSEFHSFGYPSDIVNTLTAFKATPQGVDTWNAEARVAQWELGRQLQQASNLGSLPVVILWASRPEMVTAEDRALLADIWAKLPAFSTNSVVRVVEGANHGSIVGSEGYAQHISNAVFEVIRAAQTGSALAS